MSNINGDWFHSRSSSNLGELLTVRRIVNASKHSSFKGISWSAGRKGNTKLYQLSNSAGIEPSTMQTKVRAMIRYGFIKNEQKCPLQWTPMGKLWDELYSSGNKIAAMEIYQLTLATSLALLSFTEEGFSYNPSKGELPLKYVLNSLDANNSITIDAFADLVDGDTERVGRNTSYWIRDLTNSAIFEHKGNELVYTGKYTEFVQQVKNFTPLESLTDQQWVEILHNPLIEISPFKDSIQNIFEDIIINQNLEDREIVEPLVDIISEQKETEIDDGVDILSDETRYANSSRKVRNSTWSKKIKKRFNYKCAVPECDVEGKIFLESAHVKPDSVENGSLPHRAHILNGLCLCRICHTLFDNGYFTLTDDSEIMVSSQIEEISDQLAKDKIIKSEDKKIKSAIDGRFPLKEFIEYHRDNKYKG